MPTVRLLSIAGGFWGVLQSLQRVVERKTAGFLARREFLKRGQELPNILLGWHHDEGVIDPPPAVIYALVVSGLERIGTQIEKLRETQRHEWVLPDVQAMGALFGKDDFVLVVAERNERAVVVEIKEFLPRAG